MRAGQMFPLLVGVTINRIVQGWSIKPEQLRRFSLSCCARQRIRVEKLFSAWLHLAYRQHFGLRHTAHSHNMFGPGGTWTGVREKARVAICRKIVMAQGGGEIEAWGDGEQTSSFFY